MDRHMGCTFEGMLARMHRKGDPNVRTYRDYMAMGRCLCQIKTEHVRSECPRYVRLIALENSGFGQPKYFPHTLQELCIGVVTTRMAQCKTEVEFVGCTIYIKGKLPKVIQRTLLNMHEWACVHWARAGVYLIHLNSTGGRLLYRTREEMLERAGRREVALEFDPRRMRQSHPDYKYVCNMTE
jgi:hypothetical protein